MDLVDQPWSRTPEESDLAWRLFVSYLGSSPEETLAELAARTGVSVSMTLKASARFGWQRRRAAYQSAVDRRTTAAIERQRILQAELDCEASTLALRVAVENLRRVGATQAKNADLVLPVDETNRLLSEHIKLSRAARGEPGSVDATIVDPGAVRSIEEKILDYIKRDDERRRREAETKEGAGATK
jgi:hypothetical protein